MLYPHEWRDGNSVYVKSPYSPSFNRFAKELGGRWEAEERRWRFPQGQETKVQKLLSEIFDWEPGDAPEHAVRIRASELDEEGNRLKIGGVYAVMRKSRDAQVTVFDGVSVAGGHFPEKGGSVKYPEVEPSDDVILEIEGLTQTTIDRISTQGKEFQILR